MAATRISQYLPPNIDATKAPLAYGFRALPKLDAELNDADLLTRQRALMSLCDYLHDPEHIKDAIHCGIVNSLKKLLQDDDVTVRWKSLEVLFIISCHSVGRDAFIEYDVIPAIAQLFEDSNDIVRKFAQQAIEMVAEVPFGAEGIVAVGLIPILVARLKQENDDIKLSILDTLHFCLKVNTDHALEANAMEALDSLLYHKEAEVRAKAARDIMDLSVPLSGKEKAHETACMKRLVELMSDEDADVRANCAGAIMFIAVTTKGKYQAIECMAIETLLLSLKDENNAVRLNAVKALTCLAEAPEGRKRLSREVEKLEEMRNDRSLAVQTAVDVAIKVVTWRP